MHTNTDDKQKIRIGSGKVYITEFTGSIPADADFEVEANKLGDVSGGGVIEYKPTTYTAKSDDRLVTRTVTTDEEVTMKLGTCTWNLVTLNTLSRTGRITETGGKRTLKLGGANNDNGKKYAIRFLHEDKVDGDARITIVGENASGFTLNFTKDKETVINPEFKAEPMDTDGTLVVFEEEILGLGALSLTLAKGSATGKTKVSTVTPTAASGDTYVYKISSSAAAVTYNATCTTGWTACTPGSTDIAATGGQVITLVEIDGSSKAKAAGTVTVVDNIA